MLGASVGVRENIHFDVDLLPEAQTPFMHFLGQVVVQVSILAVASTFIIYGWRFTEFGLNQESELTGLNMAFIHIAWPIAGLFWVLFATERIVDAWKSLKSQGGLS
jgi:TRAP-type C4-dicarboxylate transport system permease small subunit